MKKMGLLTLLGVTLVTVGCTKIFKGYPYSMVNPNVSLQPLSRDQYVILGDVEGRAEGGYLFGFIPLNGGQPKTFSGNLSQGMAAKISARMQGIAEMGPIEQEALYNAMESQPDADGIIAIRIIKGEMTHIPFLFTKESVTLKGKAIKIKKD
jgi:hypothetical protein